MGMKVDGVSRESQAPGSPDAVVIIIKTCRPNEARTDMTVDGVNRKSQVPGAPDAVVMIMKTCRLSEARADIGCRNDRGIRVGVIRASLLSDAVGAILRNGSTKSEPVSIGTDTI